MAGLTKMVVGVCAAVLLAGGAVSGWQVSHRVRSTLPRPTCGSVSTHMLSADTQLLSASRGAVGCFAAAVQACKSASIGVTEMGVDGGTSYVFASEPGSDPCQITEYSQSWTANFGGHQDNVTTTTCNHAAVTAEGVTFRCNGAQFLIPG